MPFSLFLTPTKVVCKKKKLLGLEDPNLRRAEGPAVQAVAHLLRHRHRPVGLGGVGDLEEGLVLVGVKLLAGGVKAL